MQETQWIATADFDRDPLQPRKLYDRVDLDLFGQNIKSVGQQVPVICYPIGARYMLCDGARRLLAAKLAGIPTLFAVVLPEKPDETRLRLLQMSIEAHKVSLTAWERSCFLKSIMEQNGWTVTQLATAVAMRQPTVTKSLSHQRLAAPLQELLHKGSLDSEKAVIIAQEQNHDRQCEIARLYGHLSREQLRNKLRKAEQPKTPKVKLARFRLAGGFTVTITGPQLGVDSAIEMLASTMRELKRAQAKRLDIIAAQRFIKAKAGTHETQSIQTP